MGPLLGGGLLSCGYFREDQLSELTVADIVLSCNENLMISWKKRSQIDGKTGRRER
jgi:hypothetical protein